MTPNRILVVDRSKTLAQLIDREKAALGWADCQVVGVADCGQALEVLSERLFDILIIYDRSPGAGQPAFLDAVHELQPELEVVRLTLGKAKERRWWPFRIRRQPHEHQLDQSLLLMILWELESRLPVGKG